MTHEYNHQHINMICPECKNKEILKDPQHEETYCTHCGLILKDNTLPRIQQYLDNERSREMFIRNLWKRKRKTSKKYNSSA